MLNVNELVLIAKHLHFTREQRALVKAVAETFEFPPVNGRSPRPSMGS